MSYVALGHVRDFRGDTELLLEFLLRTGEPTLCSVISWSCMEQVVAMAVLSFSWRSVDRLQAFTSPIVGTIALGGGDGGEDDSNTSSR